MADRSELVMEIDERGAILDRTGKYRYRLWRRWGRGNRVCFIMLNPSTADAMKDDATIRRLYGFAKREGFAGFEVWNLFALRSTKPDALLQADNPVGSLNHEHLQVILEDMNVTTVVCAWGALNSLLISRANLIKACLQDCWQEGIAVKCLGLTKDGHPRHPLYLAGDTPLIDFSLNVRKEKRDGA